jgi:NAD(P)H-binding
MHVFVAGATGSIGGALSLRLLEEGHAVSGLARTPAKAAELSAIGMAPVHGSLDDLSVIAEAARKPRRAGRPLMRRSRGPPRVRVTGSPPHRCQEAGAVPARLLFSFIAMPPNPPRAAGRLA